MQPAISIVGTLTFTPAPDAFGSATMTVIALDNGGSDNGGQPYSHPPQTFVITVNPVNDAPTFTVGPDVVVDEDSDPYMGVGAYNISPGPQEE